MSPKAVFMDLDNTLLDSKKQVSAGNRETLTAAASQGNYMILCSGRPLSTALPLVRDLGLDQTENYIICYNGALVYNVKRMTPVFQKPMQLADVRIIFAESERLGLHCHTYDSRGLLTRSMDRETKYYMSVTGITQRTVPNLPEGLTEPPYKVLTMDLDHTGALDTLKSRVRNSLGDRVNTFYSCPEFLEFAAAGIDKGTGIQRLCNVIGLPLKDTIGIGDSENDLPMLNVTGISCCMANGTDACKEAADYITKNDCDHSGVAEVISKFVLQK